MLKNHEKPTFQALKPSRGDFWIRPCCSARGWRRNPNWSANLSIPWGSKAPWRSHDGWACHDSDCQKWTTNIANPGSINSYTITLNKGDSNLVCHVIFWEPGILHSNMSWPIANLAVLCAKLVFPHQNANTIKHTHKYKKNKEKHHKEYILHTTYHLVPSKTPPLFRLNPVNPPFAYTAWFPSLPDLWSHDPYHEAKPTATWISTSDIPGSPPLKG